MPRRATLPLALVLLLASVASALTVVDEGREAHAGATECGAHRGRVVVRAGVSTVTRTSVHTNWTQLHSSALPALATNAIESASGSSTSSPLSFSPTITWAPARTTTRPRCAPHSVAPAWGLAGRRRVVAAGRRRRSGDARGRRRPGAALRPGDRVAQPSAAQEEGLEVLHVLDLDDAAAVHLERRSGALGDALRLVEDPAPRRVLVRRAAPLVGRALPRRVDGPRGRRRVGGQRHR